MSVGEGLDGPAFYTPRDIAMRWGVQPETVRACIRSGALEAFRIGPRLYRVAADRLAAYEARKVAEAGAVQPCAEERETAERRTKRLDDALRVMRIVRGVKRSRRG